MEKSKVISGLILLFILSIILSSCEIYAKKESIEVHDKMDDAAATLQYDEDKLLSVAIVTDTGGIEDRSFNQSAWEGLEAWGKTHGLKKGIHGYDYLVSENDSDYLTNFTKLVKEDFTLIYGVGFLLEESVTLIAEEYPENLFAIIDSVVESPNVASITFAEHEGSFLVGVAAAMKTESNKIGFIGGVDSPVINKFEVGFTAGVKSINPNIELDIQYAEDFNAIGKGKSIASHMYENNIDIIYHAAGATGNGVIAEAKFTKLRDPNRDVWVIGVDRDQYEEGLYDDGDSITFTSMVKRVDIAVDQVSELTYKGDFPGGKTIIFGLENDGISVAETNEKAYTKEISKTVNEWKEKIIQQKIIVPQTREELEKFEFTE